MYTHLGKCKTALLTLLRKHVSSLKGLHVACFLPVVKNSSFALHVGNYKTFLLYHDCYHFSKFPRPICPNVMRKSKCFFLIKLYTIVKAPQNTRMEHMQNSWHTTATISCSNDTALISPLRFPKYGQNASMSRTRTVTAGLVRPASDWFSMNHSFFRPSGLNLWTSDFCWVPCKNKK